GIRDFHVTGVQTCALPISSSRSLVRSPAPRASPEPKAGRAVVVGVIDWELEVFGAQSLKDKRRVVRSLKDRLRARLNVSVAEVRSEERRVGKERRHGVARG